MKVIARAITILALIAIAVGGSALDSDNIIIPTMMILPALAWMVLLIWVNKEKDTGMQCWPYGWIDWQL